MIALKKCNECGQVFDGNLQECPSCGCPASACSDEPIQPQTEHDSYTNVGQGSTIPPNSAIPPNEFQQFPPPFNQKRSMDAIEILCYVFAGIFALSWLIQPTTSSGYVNFDGANTALRREIATFGFLILGRLTAILNK